MSETIQPRAAETASSQWVPGAVNGTPPTPDAVDVAEFVAKLKQGLNEPRVPADLKAQIVASLPSPEERERLFRELQEKGGLSFEDLLASLDLDPQP